MRWPIPLLVSCLVGLPACDVTDEAGAEYLWTAEFTDDDGTHSHSIAPK